MTLCLSEGHLRSPPVSNLTFHDSMIDRRYDGSVLILLGVLDWHNISHRKHLVLVTITGVNLCLASQGPYLQLSYT